MDSARLENLLLGPRQFLRSKPIQRPLIIPTNEMVAESLFKSSMNHVDHLDTKTFPHLPVCVSAPQSLWEFAVLLSGLVLLNERGQCLKQHPLKCHHCKYEEVRITALESRHMWTRDVIHHPMTALPRPEIPRGVVGQWEVFNDEYEKDWTPKRFSLHLFEVNHWVDVELAPIINKQFDNTLNKAEEKFGFQFTSVSFYEYQYPVIVPNYKPPSLPSTDKECRSKKKSRDTDFPGTEERPSKRSLHKSRFKLKRREEKRIEEKRREEKRREEKRREEKRREEKRREESPVRYIISSTDFQPSGLTKSFNFVQFLLNIFLRS
ncbi:unnamed protein product [Leuciscus chuanchicus]